MSFVTAQPEALTAAAASLQGLGSAMAAQNAAAAAPTTGVVPAAADEVSALQATQFAAYGSLYQQVSAQATAIHEMFVNTLGTSAGSYGATEAANSAAAGSSAAGPSGILGLLTGSASGPYGLLPATLSNSGIVGALQLGNFGSAASDLLQIGSPASLTGDTEGLGAGGSGGTVLVGAAGPAGAVGPAGVVGPAGAAGFGGTPVVAGVGQASSAGGLSVPPSWTAQAASASGAAPATLTGAGWTTAAPQSTPATTMPAGIPAMASAGREGSGLGAPRYGVKPKVIPRPSVG